MNENPFLGTPAPSVTAIVLINLNEEKKEYVCPLSGYIFAEPVVLSNGRTYEREFAVRLLQDDNPIDPVTREPINKNFIQPNWSMKKLTTIFLAKHPEFIKDVYCPNPILQLLEKSLHSPNNNLEDNLINILNTHQDFLKKIEYDDVEQILRVAYKSSNLATFFAILKHFKILAFQDIAIELMTASKDQEQTSYPNVFYMMADLKNLPDDYFDLAVNIIGVENCQKLFAQQHTNWPTVFQMFWLSKEFKRGKNVLTFLSHEDQRSQLTSQLTLLCEEYHGENDDDVHEHTHNFSNLLDYMLTQYPDEDITETITLLKVLCIDQIEKILIETHSSAEPLSLLHYALTQANLENGLQLAQLCSPQNVNRIILMKFKETKVIKFPQISGNDQDYQIKHQNHELITEYSNLVHRCSANKDFASAINLLHLLNEDAAQALLTPWKTQQNGLHSPLLNFPNAIQYLYIHDKSDICEIFLEKQFLTHEQFLTALSAKLESGWSIFSFAITALNINSLQKTINILGNEKSKELILAPVLIHTNTPGIICNCVNMAIKIVNPESIAIIDLLMTTLNGKRNELLRCPCSQEHIFITLCSMNNPARTELILNYFDDINLLARAYAEVIKSNNNISLSTKNNFTKLLSNRFRSLLKNPSNTVDNSYELIYFAINTISAELLKDYLTLWNYNQLKQNLITPRLMSYSGTKIQINPLTYALLYLNKQHVDTKQIIELLIAALQEKSIDAVKNPYSADKNFIFSLINNHDEAVFAIVINIFTKIEDLAEMIRLINSNFFLNDAAKKLLNVIFSRSLTISSLNNSAAEQNIIENDSILPNQPKISEIAAASLSRTLNPHASGAHAVKDITGNLSDCKEDNIDISRDVKPY